MGPDGKLWFTELIAGQIGTLDPTNPTQGIVNYGTTQGMPANAQPYGITTGPDGQGHQVIWFTDLKNNALGEIDTSGTIHEFPVTTQQHPLIGFNTFDSVITAGPGGKLYFTEAQFGSGSSITASGIGIYDPSTQTWSQVRLPSGSNQEPFGLTVGPDGNIWFSEGIANSGGTGFQSSALGLILNSLQLEPHADRALQLEREWLIRSLSDRNRSRRQHLVHPPLSPRDRRSSGRVQFRDRYHLDVHSPTLDASSHPGSFRNHDRSGRQRLVYR